MSAGTFEFDDRGRKLFKPNVPSFPALDEVHDLLDPAMASIREFDRRLGAWNRDAAAGRSNSAFTLYRVVAATSVAENRLTAELKSSVL
jgi:hypothetical protein